MIKFGKYNSEKYSKTNEWDTPTDVTEFEQ